MLYEGQNQNNLLKVRSRVTVDSLLEWLISSNKKDLCPTLIDFLQNMDLLEQLEHLPEILELQRFLVETFSGRIALSDIENMTIHEFCSKIDESYQEKFLHLCSVLLQIWNRLADKVKRFEGILTSELTKMNVFGRELVASQTPAAFLFPSSSGTGLCSYALIMLLLDTHNKLMKSELPPIHPYSARKGHLASISKAQIQTLLLAHTRYYFTKNGVTTEEYDIESMERSIQERFIVGRPRLLESELPKIKFLEDRSRFEQIQLSSKILQEELSNPMQHKIETELKSLPDLCQLLESLYTARDFLLQTGAKSQLSLESFLATLHLYNGSSETGMTKGPLYHLQLAHIDSLLNFLLLVRAKRMIKQAQSPFDQVIPLAYRCSLPTPVSTSIREYLISIDHVWLLPNLFDFIWTRLRNQPIGDTSGQPEWRLKDALASHVEHEEEFTKNLDDQILVKHAVDLFECVTRAVF